MGKTKRGKGSKIMAVADGSGLPIAVHVDSASHHEVTLVEATLDAAWSESLPGRLVGDKAYDSDPLDGRLLEERGVDYNKLFIYAGGFEEWIENGMPVEKGQRKPPRWPNGQ